MSNSPQASKGQRVMRRLCLLVCCVIAGLAAVFAPPSVVSGASAASIGGITPSGLDSTSWAITSGAPIVLSWENFDGPNGTNIPGTSPDWGPGIWRSFGGTWRIRNGRADANSVSLGSINIHNPGVLDAAAEITLFRSGSTSFDAGLLFNDNDYSVLVLRYQAAGNGTLALYSWNGGFSLLSSVSNLYPAGIGTAPASIRLRVRTSGAQIEAFIDGTSMFTYTLTAGEQATYKAAGHDGYGLWAEFDSRTKFDDFHLDTP